MMQPDLFTQPYPNSPGFADTDTSIDAAQDMEPKAPRLRQMVLDALYSHGGLTADEAAGRLEKDILSIRPRFSELAALDLIANTGLKRPNKSGKKAIVWAVKDQQDSQLAVNVLGAK